MSNLQSTYSRQQQRGYVGGIANATAPYMIRRGIAGVAVKPGDGVYYDASTDKWIKPTSAATRLLVTGVVTSEQGSLATAVSGGIPSGSNSPSEVVFAANSSIRIMTEGYIFIMAGAALEMDAGLVYDQTAGDWIAAPTATASLIASPRRAITVEDELTSDGGIFAARIGSLNY